MIEFMDNKDYSSKSEPIFSKCVKAGHRFYYIDVKTDCNGSAYVVLTESKSVDSNGNKKRHRIFLYQEDLLEFSESFNDAIQYIKSNYDVTPKKRHSDEVSECFLDDADLDLNWDKD